MLIETLALTLRRGDRVLLTDLRLTVSEGERWAVLGPNGVGKSTLLAALAGARDAVAAGGVRRAPGAWVASVTQAETGGDEGASLRDLARVACAPLLELGAEVDRRAAALADASAAELETFGATLSAFEERGGYELDARLDEALERVGLDRAADRPVARASGGERRRARLAGALAAGADLLLLDEPTNHLDLAARDALAERLRRFRGGLVFASHDRAWIDEVATHVVWLGDGPPRLLRGGWSTARRSVDHERRTDDRAERLRQRRVAELEAMAAELRAQAHRRAHVRRRRAERELDALADAPRRAAVRAGPAVAFEAGTDGGDLARLDHLALAGVLEDASLVLRGGDRFALVGPSGSGKSTLLRLIAGEVDSDDPRARRWWRPGTSVWHLDQHRRGLDDDATPLDALSAWVGSARAEALLGAARLPREAWRRPATTLSGGERARAGLALLMAREADVLLLDEPTNDLDLPAIEALEAALTATPATVVLATHDARLVEALRAEVVTIEGRRLTRWRGGLAGWRRGALRQTPAADARHDAGGRPSGKASPATSGRAPAPIDQDPVDHDAQRAAAEEVLADPLRWGERERDRWRERRRVAEEALIAAWDRQAAPPAPALRTREAGWTVWGERSAAGLQVWLDETDPAAMATVRWAHGDAGLVAHLVAASADDRCLTRPARTALLRGGARLAIYHGSADVVQVAAPDDPGGFEALSPGWWLLRRTTLEREERWLRPARPPPRRRRRRRRPAAERIP